MRSRIRSGGGRIALAAVATGVVLAAAGCGNGNGSDSSGSGGGGGSKAAVEGRPGLLADRGARVLRQAVPGRLQRRARLRHDGTGKVDGHKIKVTEVDDAGDPAKAVSAAKDLIGKGVKIIAGTGPLRRRRAGRAARRRRTRSCSSPGRPPPTRSPASTSTRSARAARRTRTSTPRRRSSATPRARRSLVFAQDSAFGKANAAAVKAVLGGSRRDGRRDLLVPARRPTSRRSPSRPSRPSRTCSSSPGPVTRRRRCGQRSTSRASSRDHGRHRAGRQRLVTTPTARRRKINFLSHYFPGAPDNAVNKAMVDGEEGRRARPTCSRRTGSSPRR